MFKYLRKKKKAVTLIESIKDVYWNLTSFLLRAKTGATTGQQNNTIVDSSSNNFTITRSGNVAQGTFSPYGDVGGSLYFDGSGDYLSIPQSNALTIGLQDFTIEWWQYVTAYPHQYFTPFQIGRDGVCGNYQSQLGASFESNGAKLYATVNTGTYSYVIFNGTSTPLNTWSHYALVRTGGVLKLFQNGVQIDGDKAFNFNIPAPSASTYFGAGVYGAGGGSWYYNNGYLSDLRIVKGTALYTAAFTPPTAPLTAIANTQLLLSGTNAAIKDYSGKSDVETAGDAKTSTSVKKFTEAAMYFDGSGDCITCDGSGNFAFGTGNFTIECWWYATAYSTPVNLFDFRPQGGTGVYPRVLIGTDSRLYYEVAESQRISTPTAIQKGVWNHVAIARSGTLTKMFLNGVQVGNTYTDTNNYIVGASRPAVGGNGNSLGTQNLNGFMDDVRITKGVARYLTDFAVDTTVTTDPYAAQTITIATNGVNNATNNTILDSSSNNLALTRNGNVTQGTFSPFSNSKWSAEFKDTKYLTNTTTSLTNLSGDFTIEAWCFARSVSGNYSVLASSTQGTAGWVIRLQPDRSLVVQVGNTSTGDNPFGTAAGVFTLNTWNHVAVVRSAGVIKVYLNGTQVSTQTNSITSTASGFYIGTFSSVAGSSGFGWDGYITDFRITNTAVYTATFTPPTTALTAITGTRVLLFQSNRFIDNSSNAIALTTGGSPAIVAFSPFAPTTYSAALHGGSLYFDGSGDWVATATSTNLQLGTSDFTFEFWMYQNSANANSQVPFRLDNGGNQYNGIALQSTGTSWALYATASGGAWDICSGVTFGNPVNTAFRWSHLALTRQGSTWRLFLDGVQTAMFSSAAAVYQATNGFRIGTGNNVVGADNFNGYISNVRFVKGTALYTANFSVPTAPLTAVTNTQLLLSGTNSGVFDSTGKVVVETVGSAAVSTSTKKYGSSISLNGTTDYVKITSFGSFGTGDFTIECWYKPSSVATQAVILDTRRGSDAASGVSIYHGANSTFNFALATTAVTGTVTAVAGVWQHLALVRSGTTVTLYVNGVSGGTTTSSLDCSNATFSIGSYASGAADYCNGFIEDVRVTKGVARYTSGFTPPTLSMGTVVRSVPTALTSYQPTTYDATAGDPYYNQTVLHMHMDGLNGSTVFADQKGATLTAYGNAAVTSAQPKFGTSSYVGDGSGDYVLVGSSDRFSFATNDFTIEGWVRPAIATLTGAIFMNGSDADLNAPFCLRLVSGVLSVFYNNGSDNSCTTVFAANTWYHVAMTRSSGVCYLFVNGVMEKSFVQAGSSGATDIAIIGANYNSAAAVLNSFNGYIDELRITKGVARYTSNFTPATTQFPDYQDFTVDPYFKQSMLVKAVSRGNNNTILDSSSNNLAVTRAGNVAQGTFSPFSNSGWSANLASGANINYGALSSSVFNFGVNDFTIEAFYNCHGATSGYANLFSVGKGTLFGSQLGIALDLTNSRFDIYTTQQVAPNYNVAGAPKGGEWHHVALVRASGTLKLYLDGVSIFSVAFSGNADYSLPTFCKSFASSCSVSISNVRVTDTAVYSANFTPPTSRLLAVSGTKLLTLQSNRLMDEGPQGFTVTTTGTVSVDAFSPFTPTTYGAATNGGSLYFDGTGDYATVPINAALNLDTADFTIEGWLYTTALGSNQALYGKGPDSNNWMSLYARTDNKVAFSFVQSGTAIFDIASPTTLSTGQWYHIAATRNGSAVRLFINGTLAASATSATAIPNWAETSIGARWVGGTASPTGYVSDLRVVKGTALYTANFTPPTAPLTAVTNTQLLLGGTNSAILDATGKVLFETISNAKTDLVNKKYSGSISLSDAALDSISSNYSPFFNLNTSDFTIEFWAFPLGGSSWQRFFTIEGPSYSVGMQLYHNDNTRLDWGQYGVASAMTAASGSVTLKAWNHLAVVKRGTYLYFYANGVQVGSCNGTLPENSSNCRLTFGNTPLRYSGSGVNSLIDGFRVTKGVARYISNFTVPLKEFPV